MCKKKKRKKKESFCIKVWNSELLDFGVCVFVLEAFESSEELKVYCSCGDEIRSEIMRGGASVCFLIPFQCRFPVTGCETSMIRNRGGKAFSCFCLG